MPETLPKSPRTIVAALMTALLVAQLAICVMAVPIAMSGRADFRQLYTAGNMVRSGHAGQLYDYDASLHFQNALVSPEAVALPFDHLAYEAALFAPLSLLTYRAAYAAFFALNFLLLGLAFQMLLPRLRKLFPLGRWMPAALFVCFLPVAIALIQGQDSIILLVVMIAVSVSLYSGRETIAGTLLALALFKFQFAIPIALLFLAWRRWRFVAGFAAAGMLLTAISVWIVGIESFMSYEGYLVTLSMKLSTEAQRLRYGVYPGAMPNLRGLAYIMAGARLSSAALQATTVACSGLLLLWAAKRRASFSLAVCAALLVSYHGLIHDAVILIVPMGLILAKAIENLSNKIPVAATALIIFAAPTLLFFCGQRYSLLAAALLPFLLMIGEGDDRVSSGEVTL